MENTYDELLARYKETQEKLSEYRQAIYNVADGFRYVTCLRCYGSSSYQTFENPFFVQELCDEYYGDNGIVDVYTTNPKHDIRTYGDVNVLTEEELLALAKEDISMSRAVCNWITKSM